MGSEYTERDRADEVVVRKVDGIEIKLDTGDHRCQHSSPCRN